jgi:hypothetical protein
MANFLSDIILDLSKDNFQPITCDEIEELGNKASFIFFGSSDELYGGKYSHLVGLASLDSYNHPHQKVHYFINNERSCKKEHSPRLAKYPPYALNMHKDLPLEIPESTLDSVDDVIEWISQTAVFVTLQWGERASSLLKYHDFNAIVLFVENIDENTQRSHFVRQLYAVA